MGFCRPAQQLSWENFQKRQRIPDIFYFIQNIPSTDDIKCKKYPLMHQLKEFPLMFPYLPALEQIWSISEVDCMSERWMNAYNSETRHMFHLFMKKKSFIGNFLRTLSNIVFVHGRELRVTREFSLRTHIATISFMSFI